MNKKSRWLITGGAGFIGSHIAERLLNEGHFVRVLDNFSSGKEENLSFAAENTNFDLIRGDIRDRNTCLKATEGMDYVLHQAALRSVPKSMEVPHEFNEVNIGGTLNMLEASSEKGIKRFVFASSSSVYGNVDTFPESEDFYPLLISPYALTKLAGEYYCRIFSENFDLETVCLRYFNVFGPRQAPDDEYAVVIPKFIDHILGDRQPPIFGTGEQSRDFTYIDNVVEANILAATSAPRHRRDARAPGAASKPALFHEVFNVANGQDHSVLKLTELLSKIIGKEIKPAFLPPRKGDVFRTNADISKIRNALGFAPKVDFEEGLRKTVEWFQKN